MVGRSVVPERAAEVERAVVPSSLGSDHLPVVAELEPPRQR
jgi:endonuclease/exonuclease/phosphatase (EEP) superfamily protein YafD